MGYKTLLSHLMGYQIKSNTDIKAISSVVVLRDLKFREFIVLGSLYSHVIASKAKQSFKSRVTSTAWIQ